MDKMELDQQVEARLALQAATLDVDVALAAWQDLMQSTQFDQLGPATQRIAPAIFHNLCSESDFLERFRLRGTFKYAWVRNQQLIHPFLPIVSDLAAHQVRFCLTKGAALIALGTPYGCRIMSDIDIVVRSGDLHVVEQVMARHGFRMNDASACPRHPAEAHGGSINFNSASCRVDVHVADMRDPTHLFEEMLANPLWVPGLKGTSAPIARPELLMLHTMHHGLRGRGETDLLQAAVDEHLLRPFVEETQFMRDMDRLAQRSLVRVFYEQRGQVTGQHTMIARSWREDSRRLNHALRALVQTSMPSIGRRISAAIQRGMPLNETRDVDLTSLTHPKLYRWWLRAGRLASLERWATRAVGGFLTKPEHYLEAEKFEYDFTSSRGGFQANTGASARCFDWRWKVTHGFASVDCIIEFRHESFDHLDAHVYVNGHHLAKIFGGDAKSRILYIRDMPRESEFSLRPMSTVCADCYTSLDNMIISMELTNAIS